MEYSLGDSIYIEETGQCGSVKDMIIDPYTNELIELCINVDGELPELFSIMVIHGITWN